MKNILLYIQNELKSFSKTEIQLANYILKQPEKVINMSIKELSIKTGVSCATIVRFCKNIGIDGYSNFKIHLSSNIPSIKDKSYSEIEKNEDINLIIDKLELRLHYSVSGTKKLINKNILEECINILHNASQIQTFGIGASSLVASDIYQKFVRLGLPITFNLDYHIATTSLSVAKEGTIFIGISYSGNTKEILNLIKLAKKRNLKTIIITSDNKSLCAKNADYVLLTEKSVEHTLRTAATISLITQLFVVDIIFFRYVSKYYDDIFENLKISKETLNTIRNQK